MKYESWIAEHYKVIQLILDVPAKYRVVWAMPDDKKGNPCGPHHLEAQEIEVLGVAEVTAKTYRRPRGSKQPGVVVETAKYTSVVVLELTEGFWQVSNECSNFAGIMSEGQELGDCIGELDGKFRDLLPSKGEG